MSWCDWLAGACRLGKRSANQLASFRFWKEGALRPAVPHRACAFRSHSLVLINFLRRAASWLASHGHLCADFADPMCVSHAADTPIITNMRFDHARRWAEVSAESAAPALMKFAAALPQLATCVTSGDLLAPTGRFRCSACTSRRTVLHARAAGAPPAQWLSLQLASNCTTFEPSGNRLNRSHCSSAADG